ncbi:hypothetical protein [Flavobacterium sp. 14A]|uniref:hypothetical protein n=1 Tax=Flavobacterium sp. 14A TaxID=2735896 RepID=UPI00156F1476|nr:hypothetical protein [Flavobacterium sp. 14A]NRT12860.1 hypothetical protein [Flavobacterium sp. 14A]
MNSKRFFVFAILLYCNLFLSSCSSDLNFDQINDFSAEPEIVGNLAYFELPIPSSIPSLPPFPFPTVNAKFDILRDASVSDRLLEATLFFEVENINVKQYEIIVEFKDVNDRVLDRISIPEAHAKYDDINKKISQTESYTNSRLNILKSATNIDFTVLKIASTTPIIVTSSDTLKFRSTATIKLAL